MEWVSFLTGVLGAAFAFSLFKDNQESEEDETDPVEEENELIVNSHTGRSVTLSCQTCRKLKKHKEVEQDLFQCMKCKRYVDLRQVS